MKTYTCSRCSKPIVWAVHLGIMVALDADSEPRFMLPTMREDNAEPRCVGVQTYQRHDCPVPR